jgi:hypothetical protein
VITVAFLHSNPLMSQDSPSDADQPFIGRKSLWLDVLHHSHQFQAVNQSNPVFHR